MSKNFLRWQVLIVVSEDWSGFVELLPDLILFENRFVKSSKNDYLLRFWSESKWIYMYNYLWIKLANHCQNKIGTTNILLRSNHILLLAVQLYSLQLRFEVIILEKTTQIKIWMLIIFKAFSLTDIVLLSSEEITLVLPYVCL